MLICKRRQDKNQSYTCKKQVSLPGAVRRLYLHLRLQPKRLKPFPPSPKSPRRPNLLQLLTALKSELRQDWREPSPKPQITISAPQCPPCCRCSLCSLCQGKQQLPAHHTTHSRGSILVDKTPWSMPNSPVIVPMAWQHHAHNPDWRHARSYIFQGKLSSSSPSASSNGELYQVTQSYASLGFFKHLKEKRERNQSSNPCWLYSQ